MNLIFFVTCILYMAIWMLYFILSYEKTSCTLRGTGRLAQMVERLLSMREVPGSIPGSSKLTTSSFCTKMLTYFKHVFNSPVFAVKTSYFTNSPDFKKARSHKD